MKKSLLLFGAGLIISAGVFAQYDPENWLVDDQTQNVTALTGLTKTNDYDTELSGQVITTTSPYTYSWETNEVVKIAFTHPGGANWNDFGFLTVQWEGDAAASKFMKDLNGDDQDYQTARGYTIDFTNAENRLISFDVQASADLELRLDLKDIAGKTSNGASPNHKVAATTGGVDITDAAKWTNLKYSWGGAILGEVIADASVAIMEDWYSDGWWSVDNEGIKDAENPLSPNQIVGFVLTIDDGNSVPEGTAGDAKDFYIKNIVIGNSAPTTYSPWVNIETVEGNQLEVVNGVVYSATISVVNVLGQVIATAQGQFDISTLPAGVYSIVTAEGTAKIVK